MNKNKIIRLTNGISLISIILLMYWVFTFITIQVFGFRVFRENITETFYFSILGILSLLTGAVIVNVMFNLTKISEVMSGEYQENLQKISNNKKYYFTFFILSFPLLFALLYFGDLRSASAKEDYLVSSANFIVDNNKELINDFIQLENDSAFITNTSHSLKILSGEFESFPSISIIYQVEEKGRKYFININSYSNWYMNQDLTNFIYACSLEEKEYLTNVFSKDKMEHRFSSSDGNYELYYPVKIENKVIVMYCTDFQRYGKLGS